MMRVCHLNTCPVGIATQDPELRKTFNGTPEFVQNFFRFMAEEVRELMAELGFRTLDEMIGRADASTSSPPAEHGRRAGSICRRCCTCPDPPDDCGAAQYAPGRRPGTRARSPADRAGDAGARHRERRSRWRSPIRNTDRTAGTLLGYEVTRRFGGAGLPDDTIRVNFTGAAGQSFGAFLPRGITLSLEGEANDFVGKGLSGAA